MFLGSVAVEGVAALASIVDEAAGDAQPFAVRLAHAGGQVGRRGSVAWLGIGEGAREVIGLADRVRAACPDRVALGAEPRRTPSAHLTVARRVDERLIAALRERRLGPLEASWTVDRMALYRSRLGPAGATYETLRAAPFSGAT